MTTHENAKDPKDIGSTEIVKPDPKFQSFFSTIHPTTGVRKGPTVTNQAQVGQSTKANASA